MLYRLPLRTRENRGERNGDVAEHIHREAQAIRHELAVRRADLVAFKNRGERSERHKPQHARHQRHDPEAQGAELAGGRDEAERHEQRAQHHARQRQHGERTDHERQVHRGEITFANRVLDERGAIVTEHLQESLAPTHSLAPRLRERHRLLVIQHGLAAVADLVAMHDRVHRELKVLGQQVELPTTVAFHDFAREQEAGASHVAAGAEDVARAVEEPGFTHEPQGGAGGHPVVGEVHGIAVARQRIEPCVERLVHLRHVMLVEQIVGVEHDVGVIFLGGAAALDVIEQIGERIAFAHLLLVEALDHMASHAATHLGGVVVAIVCHDPDVDEFARIRLVLDARDEISDDLGFIARRDKHAVVFVGRGIGIVNGLGEESSDDAHHLVGDSQEPDDSHEDVDECKQSHVSAIPF